MTIYEMRTYTLHVGKMEVDRILPGRHGYGQSTRPSLEVRRRCRPSRALGVFANKDFIEGFAVKFRPLVASQEVKLLTAAPWGPHP